MTFPHPFQTLSAMPKTLMGPNQAHDLQEINSDLFNKDYARSLWNLLPETFRPHLETIPPEYFGMTEHEMEKKFKPDVTTSRLRVVFWLEYDRAQAQKDKMRISSVYSPVISKQAFQSLLGDPQKLAYILCPPADYIVSMTEILSQGVKAIRKIVMAQNLVDEWGNLNPKIAEVVLKAVDMVHIRVHGAPVIRTESKSVNVNMNQNQQLPSSSKSVKELEIELAQLQGQTVPALEASKSESVVEVIDVETVKVEIK